MRTHVLNIFFLFLFVIALPACSEADEFRKDAVRIKTASGDEMVFYVEIAQTKVQQQKGLMHRPYMPEDAGMLFVFNGEGNRTFWMENTLIPLDMIFIKEDGTIAHIHSMAKPQSRDLISSGQPVSAVLEINGGLSDQFGIRVGDKVISPFFKNTVVEQ